MTTTTTYKKQHLLVLNTCANAWPGVSEVYSNGLELLFDAVEHQPYLRDVERQHVYFMVGDYRHMVIAAF
jgi:hypothetical protein